MAPTHSGATAPVRAQGPARYSVLEQGLQQQAPKRKLVTWGGGARRGGETGGPSSPGTRVLDRVGWERPGRIPGRGLNPSLPHLTLRELAVSSKAPGAAGAELTKKIGCQGARVGRLRGLSGPRGRGGTPAPRHAPHPGRGAGEPLAPRPSAAPCPRAPGREGGWRWGRCPASSSRPSLCPSQQARAGSERPGGASGLQLGSSGDQ